MSTTTRLIQIVSFVNVAPAATVPLPHTININGVPKRPDYVAADVPGFTIVVTATQVSVTNTTDAPASVNVWLELKHSIPRQLGSLPNLTPQPFIAAAGSGGGGASGLPFTEVTNNDSEPFAVGAPIAVTGLRANARCSNFPNDTPLDFAKVLGLCTAATPVGNTAVLIDAGPLTLTTAEWDAITGDVGGLTPNALYYLGTTVGTLTRTPNSSHRIVYVGEAIDATTLHINIDGAMPDVFNKPQDDTDEGFIGVRVRADIAPYTDPNDDGEIELTRIGQGASVDNSFGVLDLRDVAQGVAMIGAAAPVVRFNRFLTANNYQGIFVGNGATVNNQQLLQSYILAEAGGAGGSFSGFRRGNEFLVAGPHPLVFVYNHGPGSITLLHQNIGSDPANRIICPGGVDLVIRVGGGWIMTYDTVLNQRWFIMGVNA